MNKLLTKILSGGSNKMATVLSESPLYDEKDLIPVPDLPILNIAFSGLINGGLVPGLTMFAGESKCYKTLLALLCLKAYMEKYSDAIGLIYDSEFSITPQYLKAVGLDASRIAYVPVEHLEHLKFDIVDRLKKVERGDKVMVIVDSIGSLGSKKEIEDAENEKSVVDMTRAKSLRSVLRIITPHFTMKDIPGILINHVYQEIGMYPKTIVGGGTSAIYMTNQIFIITKRKEKEDNELVGNHFTINIEKSRFVKEGSKFSFYVDFNDGMFKWSGLFDLAMEAGLITSEKPGWYKISGAEKAMRKGDLEKDDKFWENLLEDEEFGSFVENKYRLASQ